VPIHALTRLLEYSADDEPGDTVGALEPPQKRSDGCKPPSFSYRLFGSYVGATRMRFPHSLLKAKQCALLDRELPDRRPELSLTGAWGRPRQKRYHSLDDRLHAHGKDCSEGQGGTWCPISQPIRKRGVFFDARNMNVPRHSQWGGSVCLLGDG